MSTAKPNVSVRLRAVPATEPALKEFADLHRRMLVIVSQLKCARAVFGDLSSLTGDDADAGMVVCEAALALEQLADDFDAWSVKPRGGAALARADT